VQALIETLERAAKSRASLPEHQSAPEEKEMPVELVSRQETAVDATALARLQEMMGGEPAYLHELIDGFLAEAPLLMAQIEQGLVAEDAPIIRLAAHSLKTNAADFGAARLHELTVQIEMLARDGELDQLSEPVANLTETYAQVAAYLQQVRAQGGS
jgi:HPt (histidine-containing phosphotransfer) domain-containing protein